MIHTIQYVQYQACKIFPSPVAGTRKERKGKEGKCEVFIMYVLYIIYVSSRIAGRAESELLFWEEVSYVSYIEKICLLHVIPGEEVGAQIY